MDKDEFKRIIDNPEMISGIHNYCDRWCERCSFTSKCGIYAVEEHQFPNKDKDLENEAYWEKLKEIFQITMEMILDDAEDLGIDLDDIDTSDPIAIGFDAAEEQTTKLIERHAAARLSEQYMKSVANWFDEANEILEAKGRSLQTNENLGIDSDEAGQIIDSQEVISWYQYQIHVKIRRGLHGKNDYFEEDDDFPKDSDGSVKVALIGIDRSIAAWGNMLTLLPEKEDEILDLLVVLEKLRRITEKEFPEARSFVRAGFDE